MRNLDGIIGVRVLLITRNLDAIIRVSNYVRLNRCLNPGLQRARPLWSGASDKLIMPVI